MSNQADIRSYGLRAGSVLCNVRARSKKHCLEILSELLAGSDAGIANEEIFSSLIDRERLGCTSLGNGVAFPHCRLSGVEASFGALMKLSEPVDFDSPDGNPVDLIFGLIMPEEIDLNHRAEIAAVTALLNDSAMQARLRSATTSKKLYEAFVAGQREATPPDVRNVSRGA
ncbi:MAG: PTS sugar transporter subunit IIA [Woeseiaceae bacterium]